MQSALFAPSDRCVLGTIEAMSEGGYISTPIPAPERNAAPLGVLEFLRFGDHPPFTPQDQRLLEVFVNECIAPKMWALPRVSTADKVLEFLQTYSLVGLCGSRPENATLLTVATAALGALFPQTRTHRKLYELNLLNEDGVSFSRQVLYGDLFNPSHEPTDLDLEGSLTSRALKCQQCVFINDVTTATKAGALHQVTSGVRSAIAAPFATAFGRQGVLLVKSDRHDIFPDTQSTLFQFLATQVGSALESGDLDNCDALSLDTASF